MENIHLKFEEIEPFNSNTNFYNILIQTSNAIIESTDISEIIYNITQLRRMRKYIVNFFEITFNNLYDKFTRLIINENDDVSYEALILIEEVFSFYEINTLMIYWFDDIFPAIIDQTSNPNKIISNIAYRILLIYLNICGIVRPS